MNDSMDLPTPAHKLRGIYGALARAREELVTALRECRDVGLEVQSLQSVISQVAILEGGFGELVTGAEKREREGA